MIYKEGEIYSNYGIQKWDLWEVIKSKWGPEDGRLIPWDYGFVKEKT